MEMKNRYSAIEALGGTGVMECVDTKVLSSSVLPARRQCSGEVRRWRGRRKWVRIIDLELTLEEWEYLKAAWEADFGATPMPSLVELVGTKDCLQLFRCMDPGCRRKSRIRIDRK